MAGKKNSRLVIAAFVVIIGLGLYNFWFDPSSERDSTKVTTTTSTIVEDTRPFKGKGYILEFDESFNPGLNSIDDLGLSVVIAIDVSGSMIDVPASGGALAKYIVASRALTQIVDFLETLSRDKDFKEFKLNVAVIGFDSEVRIISALASIRGKGFSALRRAVSNPKNLEPGGRTAIGLAIEKGTEILAQSGTILKSLIVISDGENTEGVLPEDALFALSNNRNDKSNHEYPVYTRGTLVSFVGFDIESETFASIEKQGARLVTASNQEELRDALKNILVADITKLEAAEEKKE